MEYNITDSVEMLTFSQVDQSNATFSLHVQTRSMKSDFELTIESMNKYFMPVIILIGLIGNTASFTVFVGTHLKHQSSSIYLAFLNMVDNMFLISLGLGVWLGWIRVHCAHERSMPTHYLFDLCQ
jgi:Co/Zn/Cd efflux system component